MSRENEVRITTETVTKTFAEVIINGESKGKREVNGGPSFKEFSKNLAREFGIRTFSVSIDDSPVTSEAQAAAPVRDGSRVAVQAKDARGARRVNEPDAEQNTAQQSEEAAPAQADQGDEHTDAPEGADEVTETTQEPA